jgi:hypothetical protein
VDTNIHFLEWRFFQIVIEKNILFIKIKFRLNQKFIYFHPELHQKKIIAFEIVNTLENWVLEIMKCIANIKKWTKQKWLEERTLWRKLKQTCCKNGICDNIKLIYGSKKDAKYRLNNWKIIIVLKAERWLNFKKWGSMFYSKMYSKIRR